MPLWSNFQSLLKKNSNPCGHVQHTFPDSLVIPDPLVGAKLLMHRDPEMFLDDEVAQSLSRDIGSYSQARLLLAHLLDKVDAEEGKKALIASGVATLAPVTLEPKGGRFSDPVLVSMTVSENSLIRYTVDGTDPTVRSPRYSRPILVDAGVVVVRAIATRGCEVSPIITSTYQVTKHVGCLPSYVVGGVISIAKSAVELLQLGHKAIEKAMGSVLGLRSNERVRVLDEKMLSEDRKVDVADDSAVSLSLRFAIECEEEGVVNRLTAISFTGAVAEALCKDGITIAACDLNVTRVNCRRLRTVKLRLCWNFPWGQVDYLDGTCVIYGGTKYLDAVDYGGPLSKRVTLEEGARVRLRNMPVAQAIYNSQTGTYLETLGNNILRVELDGGEVMDVDLRNIVLASAGNAKNISTDWTCSSAGPVVHSGDLMEATGGSHAISVTLNEIPVDVTDLYFTLSAYHRETLRDFKKPSIEILDAENPDHKLLSCDLYGSGDKSAMVLACLSRKWGTGPWELVALGTSCFGNARNYEPMKDAIQSRQARLQHGLSCRWPLVRLLMLWRERRLLQVAALAHTSSLLVEAFELPDSVLRNILGFA